MEYVNAYMYLFYIIRQGQVFSYRNSWEKLSECAVRVDNEQRGVTQTQMTMSGFMYQKHIWTSKLLRGL